MQKTVLFILSICTLFSFQSCTKTPFADAELSFGLISFTDQEATSIILRQFEKGQNFSNKKDTAIQEISFNRSGDTLYMASKRVKIQITSSFDYELYFPFVNKTYRLTEINEEKQEQRKSIFNNTKELCINPITSLKVNNTIIFTQFNQFYLYR